MVVLIASLQERFTPLFKEIGVRVEDIAGYAVDTANSSNLTKSMNWKSYIGGYITKSFVNSDRIIRYLSIFQSLNPSLVVSDYNIAASIAAQIGGFRHALVTERYDFTLTQLDDCALEEGGFEVDKTDLRSARPALHSIFRWIVQTAAVVVTDKPPLEQLDEGTAVYEAIQTGRAIFTGPMIRELPEAVDTSKVRAQLNLKPGPLIVGSVGGTTMFIENKVAVIQTYLDAFRLLKTDIPDLQLVLLGREEIDAPEDVHALPYLTDWMPLLKEANVLISAPGWITVTEIAALRIPTAFVLSHQSEYHELEALKRLKLIGFPTLVAPSAGDLADTLRPFLNERLTEATPAQLRIAPKGAGTALAAKLLLDASKSPLTLSASGVNDNAVARVVLAADGSTTALLEALLGRRLKARVHSQKSISAAEAPDTASRELVLGPDDPIIERRSALVDDDGRVVSQNLVIGLEQADEWLSADGADIPIGVALRKSGVKTLRKILSNGSSTWDGGEECLFKEYTLFGDNGTKLYIHEKFNPSVIGPHI
jgi:hypothetical protein